jgi:heat shock protein HslJ
VRGNIRRWAHGISRLLRPRRWPRIGAPRTRSRGNGNEDLHKRFGLNRDGVCDFCCLQCGEKAGAGCCIDNAGATLTGTQWSLEDLAGKAVIADSRATLAFPVQGKVAGNGSCNRFAGSAEINGSTIKFGPLVATRMMCEPDASNQETQYLKALESVQRFAVKDGKLYLYPSGSDQPLRFHPAS